MNKIAIIPIALILALVLFSGCTATGPSTGEAARVISIGDGGGGGTTTATPKFIYAAKQLNSYLISNGQEAGLDLNVDTGGLTNTQLPYLYKGTINYTYNGQAYSTTEREAILLTANTLFSAVDGYGSKKLVTKIAVGAYAYDINLASGTPYPFREGAGNSIPIVFFGKNYYVVSIDANVSGDEKIVLRESNGTGTVTLRNERGYPYRPENPKDPTTWAPYNWIVQISTNAAYQTPGNKITGIKIANSQRRWDATGEELGVFTGRNVATLADGYTNQYITNLKFDGFRNTDTTTVTIGNQFLKYSDVQGNNHTIPFVVKNSFSTEEWNNFNFDGRTIAFLINTETNDLNIMEDSNSGNPVWSGKYTDGMISENTIQLPGSNGASYTYRFLVNESANSFWVVMAKQSITIQYNKIVELRGTDTKESPNKNTDKDYYCPDDNAFGYNPADINSLIANFKVKETEEGNVIGDTNVYIDTAYGSGNLITLPNRDLWNYNYQADYNAQAAYANSITLNLRSDAGSSYYSKAWSDYGSLLEVKDGVFTQIIPKNKNLISVTVFNAACGNKACEIGENSANCKGDCPTTLPEEPPAPIEG